MTNIAFDLTNKRFGRLVVLEPIWKKDRYHWRCRCDCGNIRLFAASNLRHGNTKSCGCWRRDESLCDITDKQFGEWKVLFLLGRIKNNKHLYWMCRCSCGTEKEVSSTSLRHGQSTNCGCKNKQNLIGMQFGRLTVVEKSVSAKRWIGGMTNKYKHQSAWFCICVCGKQKTVAAHDLKSGRVRSCGCLMRDIVRKPRTHGLSGTKAYEAFLSRRRRERKKKFDAGWTELMESSIRAFFNNCVLCGKTDEEHMQSQGEHLHIDHVQPLIEGGGLRPGNATILCRSCNSKKGTKPVFDLSVEDRIKILQAAESFRIAWSGGF